MYNLYYNLVIRDIEHSKDIEWDFLKASFEFSGEITVSYADQKTGEKQYLFSVNKATSKDGKYIITIKQFVDGITQCLVEFGKREDFNKFILHQELSKKVPHFIYPLIDKYISDNYGIFFAGVNEESRTFYQHILREYEKYYQEACDKNPQKIRELQIAKSVYAIYLKEYFDKIEFENKKDGFTLQNINTRQDNYKE